MHYQWANGVGNPWGDASEMYEYLEVLRSKDDLTLDYLEREAKKTSSPLHSKLDWDDKSAARKHRRGQLRTIVTKLVRVNEAGEARRVYVGVGGGDDPRHYDLVSRVMRKPAFRRHYARRALTELGNFEARFGDLPELAAVMKAMRKTLRPIIQPALEKIEG